MFSMFPASNRGHSTHSQERDRVTGDQLFQFVILLFYFSFFLSFFSHSQEHNRWSASSSMCNSSFYLFLFFYCFSFFLFTFPITGDQLFLQFVILVQGGVCQLAGGKGEHDWRGHCAGFKHWNKVTWKHCNIVTKLHVLDLWKYGILR